MEQQTISEELKEKQKKDFIKMRKSLKNMYPIVMKNKNGHLEIIYSNRVELYTLTSKEGFSKEDENLTDDAYAEIEMAKGSGYKRVCDTTEKDDWRFNDK